MTKKKRFLLRIDPDVYAALEKWAADDLRSVNAQIEFLLREMLVRAGRSRAGSARSQNGAGQSGGDEGRSDDGDSVENDDGV